MFSKRPSTPVNDITKKLEMVADKLEKVGAENAEQIKALREEIRSLTRAAKLLDQLDPQPTQVRKRRLGK